MAPAPAGEEVRSRRPAATDQAPETDLTLGPLCPGCGQQHEAMGGPRPSPMAWPLAAAADDSPALVRDAFGPEGWGRRRRC
jgi:hypothetical protein